ncbi:helix-turn-helix transcriptional regulator [Roseateles albus]|uniref:LuxR C-terminal-related transcriptional regulator n=1 Tax=Roseateles albus TaxID=2987525 RepID=A0ABT5KJJ6_9BURK|nr:LuxR family transcriptional regulator [Roseateles albus]MDC8774102.1 LuxR C-terminal-related transcriptional regulator [Roseateles albus]
MLKTSDIKAEVGQVARILGGLPQPLMVLQDDGSLVYVNPRAEQVFDGRHAWQLNGRLMHLGQLDAQTLVCLLGRALCGPVDVALWFSPGLMTGWLHLAKLGSELAQAGEWGPDNLLLTLHIDQPQLSQSARLEALCHQYRISNTERYVLMLLADGQVVDSVARQLDIQVSTLRTHVRHLLEKTHATSLMQLLCWLGSAAAAPR